MFPLINKRYFLVPCVFILGFSVLCIRTIYLYQHRSQFISVAQKAREHIQKLEGRRGNIIDAKGQCLASNMRVYELGVDQTQIQEKDFCQLNDLARLLKCPLNDLEKIWVTSDHCRWKKICDEVNESTYQAICKLRIKGLYGNMYMKRVYFDTPSLGYVVGFLNKDFQPVCGVERFMHFYLKGQDGYVETEVNGKRNELVQHRKKIIPPTHGCSVELTLDANIQSLVARHLRNAYERYQPLSIQALVTQPQSGEILALVVYPCFDPNFYNEASLESLKNKIVSDVYEPGSVFKAITVSAALDTQTVKPDDVFDCRLVYGTYKDKKLKLPNDWKTFACTMSVAEILKKSSNRGIAQIALKMGAEKLYRYGRLFGFGETTRSGFPGETRGVFYEPEKWDGLTITRLPIGHALACSLMQMHYAMGAIANDGKLMYPLFVKRIYDSKGNIVHTFVPTVRRQVIQKKTAQTMRQLMMHDVTSKAYIAGYSVSGKTGTSQKIINGHYSHSQHVSSFSGFFPSINPQIQITLTVDSPHCVGTAYGSQIAAPIFKNIAQDIIAYLGIPPVSTLL